jgi:hypothetical protein
MMRLDDNWCFQFVNALEQQRAVPKWSKAWWYWHGIAIALALNVESCALPTAMDLAGM